MSDEYLKEIVKRLDSMETDIKTFLNLFKILNSEKINEIKEKTLDHEMRGKIYDLCDGTLTVNQIAEKFNTTRQNVTYHLGVLASVGLLSFREEGRERYYFKTLE